MRPSTGDLVAIPLTPVEPSRPSESRSAAIAGTLILVIIAAAILAPWIAPWDPLAQGDLVALRNAPPSAAHWFGTDPFARDVFSRLLYGARLSLGIAAVAAICALAIGGAWGSAAGMAGGVIDAALMRVVDALLSVPRVLILLAMLALFGRPGPWQLAVLLGVTGWGSLARLTRTEVRAIREREFVRASEALGARRGHIWLRHVTPHIVAPLAIAVTLGAANVMLLEAGLSFLGVGVAPPTPSWGNVIRDGLETQSTTWWLTLFPGLALLCTVGSMIVLAERLRAAVNPRQLLDR